MPPVYLSLYSDYDERNEGYRKESGVEVVGSGQGKRRLLEAQRETTVRGWLVWLRCERQQC